MSSQNNPYAPGESVVGTERIVGEAASAGRRFLTFMVDVLVARSTFLVGEVAYVVVHGPEAYDAATSSAWSSVAFVLLYVLYYLALESIFGRTLGKVLLGTRVVTESGTTPSLSAVLVRTLSRLIPLEPVSFTLADTWWHDSLSKTKVLRVRRAG
ncbi:membrane protein [Stenotrophomonas acidaminiphila]|uniref:Membrane protein n=1 Tax=Stenotrophomonas acidaminiphila TaxID=128780 RepID=A0A0S1B1M2_9GAMM|nr:RDD family protein [Stenotrophomonas acidaminiphila]ALJ28941.1 membrane protein [Stenotrophomonas acidaminiphila]